MADENRVPKLPKGDYNLVNGNSSYDEGKFEKDFYRLLGAEEADITTPEGRGKFVNESIRATTSINSNIPAGYLRAIHEAFKEEGTNDLAEHTRKHAGTLANIVDEDTRMGLSLNYAPSTKTGHKEYDAVGEVIGEMRRTLGAIKQDPEKYYKERLDGLDDATKAFFAESGVARRIIKQDQAHVQRTGEISVAKYEGGSSKFIGDGASYMEDLRKEAQEAEETLQKEIDDRTRKLEGETEKPLSQAQYETMQAEYRDRLKALGEMKQDVKGADEMIMKLMATSAATLRAKRLNAEAAAKEGNGSGNQPTG